MSGTPTVILRSGLLLGVIALLGSALLAGVNEATRERIIEQQQRRILQQLNEIVPAALHDNELNRDLIKITDEEFFRHPKPVIVYRARKNDEPVAVLMSLTAPDGYNGDIGLLVGIDTQGVVLGVRVAWHRETPGLGDPIDIRKSDWVLGFSGKSLQNPQADGWRVRQDGGVFDQFTGATITPRAVVGGVNTALRYYRANQQRLFDAAGSAADGDDRQAE